MEHITFFLFAFHYHLVTGWQWFTGIKSRLVSKHSTAAQHLTFILVNLFFLGVYDTVKELIIPFALVGLLVFLAVSRSDW